MPTKHISQDVMITEQDDGTHHVRYWSVFQQLWCGCEALHMPEDEFQACTEDERRAIVEAQRSDWPLVDDDGLSKSRTSSI